MDISTQYLGLNLENPLVPSASPLSHELDNIKRMEDEGAGAVVLYSLFEEQIIQEQHDLHHHLTQHTESYAEALNYFTEPSDFFAGPQEYCNHIRKAKKSCQIPIIASLNGYSPGGWTEYASLIEEAGADALELNIYFIPSNIRMLSNQIEEQYLEILRSVKKLLHIPLAVKVSPFFTNTANMVHRLRQNGADGVVLFNQFYQPDIILETLEVSPHIILSTPHATRLALTWIGILFGQVNLDFAASGGVHDERDVLKLLMVGANVTMLCSALYKHGLSHLRVIKERLRHWMELHEYDSVAQMRGSMSQMHCPSPSAFERAQYIKAIF